MSAEPPRCFPDGTSSQTQRFRRRSRDGASLESCAHRLGSPCPVWENRVSSSQGWIHVGCWAWVVGCGAKAWGLGLGSQWPGAWGLGCGSLGPGAWGLGPGAWGPVTTKEL